MTILEAIVLGLVQGLTEFIPISSTAHLRIVPAMLGWKDPGAAASAVIQLGTLLAVVIYFFRDLTRMTIGFFRGLARGKPFGEPDSRLAWYVIIGTIPVAVLGLIFKDFIETGARNLWLIASALIAVAILLLIAEARVKGAALRPLEDVNMKDAVAVGFGQAMALIPGVSRSGSTMMVGLFRRLSHAAAARFSFLLSVPAILLSGLFELFAEREHLVEIGWVPIVVATISAFLSGYASIWFLLRYLKTHTTAIFIYYRIALGVLMFVLLAAGVLQAS